MNAAQIKSRRDEVALHILELVKDRAKRKGCRVKRLQDAAAREGVINGALARLMAQSTRENFWYEEGEERDDLIRRALDAELKSYTRATAASGGTAKGELVDPTALENLSLHTEKGIPQSPGSDLDPIMFAHDPAYLYEQQEGEDAREREAAKELETVRQNLNAYSESLRFLAHRKAFDLICNEPQLTNKAIAETVSKQSARGISQQTVAKIRERYNEIAEPSLLLKGDIGALKRLQRRVETVEKEMDAIRAERRRDLFLRNHSPEEFEAFRAWSAPFCEAFETTTDDLFGATISQAKCRGSKT